MEIILVTTEDFKAYTDPLPEGVQVFGFKFVRVGPNTLELAKRMGAKICEIVDEQQSFFIIGESSQEMRKVMHNYIDRFCDLTEGK